MSPRITGWILAGGQSSRMGRDKAFLPVGSQTLIEHVRQRIHKLVDRVVVIGHPGNLQPLQALLGDCLVTDLLPGQGPLMGVYTGLMLTETALNLYVPCDMPWIERRLVERLLAPCREDHRIIASRHPVDGIQPFPLVCHVAACRTIGALLDRQERSLQVLWREPSAQLVTIDAPCLWGAFANVNTPADYATLPRRS